MSRESQPVNRRNGTTNRRVGKTDRRGAPLVKRANGGNGRDGAGNGHAPPHGVTEIRDELHDSRAITIKGRNAVASQGKAQSRRR